MSDFNYLGTDDVRLRNAIVEVYRRKCFYCGRAIDVNTLEIDHIIPKNGKDEVYPDEYNDFDKYLEELKSNAFEINSIINYLPSCGSCNKKREMTIFQLQTLDFFMNIQVKRKIK